MTTRPLGAGTLASCDRHLREVAPVERSGSYAVADLWAANDKVKVFSVPAYRGSTGPARL
jgi:hypothetical protein